MTDATDVFISYKREDRSLAEQVAAALRANRYSVYYDIALEHGQEFADALDERIRAAKIVIVLWTDKSVQSKWVRREARFAAKHGKYHPVHVGDIDLPMDLHGYHAVALSERFELEPIVASVLGRLAPTQTDPSAIANTKWATSTKLGSLAGMFGEDWLKRKMSPAETESLLTSRRNRTAGIEGQKARFGLSEELASQLESLSLAHSNVTDLTELRQFKNLRALDISYLFVVSLSPLTYLKNTLEVLKMERCHETDIEPLASLTKLQDLNLNGNHATTLEPIRPLKKLRALRLQGFMGFDFDPLRNLDRLELLQIPSGEIYGGDTSVDRSSRRAEVRNAIERYLL